MALPKKSEKEYYTYKEYKNWPNEKSREITVANCRSYFILKLFKEFDSGEF